MLYKLTDSNEPTRRGKLQKTEHRGKTILESKEFYQTENGFYSNPRICFYRDDGTNETDIDLKRTATGWTGCIHGHAKSYGANLNKIRNRAGRYGLTVWCEPKQETAAQV